MRVREITDEEIEAITTLIQRSENNGSVAYTEEDIYRAINAAYQDTPRQRAKDCDTEWIISFMGKVKEMLDISYDFDNYLSTFFDSDCIPQEDYHKLWKAVQSEIEINDDPHLEVVEKMAYELWCIAGALERKETS